MKPFKAIVYGVFLTLISTHLSASHSISVDVSQKDVAGIRLGNTLEQVKATISMRYGNEVTNRMRLSRRKSPGNEELIPKIASFQIETASITVYFEPDISKFPDNHAIVSQVVYSLPWSVKNKERMYEMALERYGQPSNTTVGISWHWCEQPSVNTGLGCSEYSGPKIVLHNTKLELSNYLLKKAVIEFNNNKRNTAPSF